jgi:hypothetical protein
VKPFILPKKAKQARLEGVRYDGFTTAILGDPGYDGASHRLFHSKFDKRLVTTKHRTSPVLGLPRNSRSRKIAVIYESTSGQQTVQSQKW